MMTVAKTPALRAQPSPAVSLIARLGYATRGTIYLLVAGFAAAAALRPGYRPQSMSGAVQAVASDPLGFWLALPLAAGLACLAAWFAIAAVSREDFAGPKRWLLSLGMLGDAGIYSGFVLIVLGLLVGRHGGGEHDLQAWTAWLLAHPFGRWLVGGIALAVLGAGLGLIGWALLGDPERRLDMAEDEKRLVRPFSRAGLAGRGLAVAIAGGYALAAAIDVNPREAHELGGVLTQLRGTAYGRGLMALFALVFAASAVFDFVTALYRRVDPKQP